MNRCRIFVLGFALIFLLAAAVEPALAQCPMCKQAVANSAEAESAARGLNLAIVVLLAPPVLIFAGIFGVIYRHRNIQDKR
ncbi:MAG TPA: hypothetical protein VF131_27025 [Blastocatellia bacterium]|nr:hypothetical protein [Blastocatellia bacterium]